MGDNNKDFERQLQELREQRKKNDMGLVQFGGDASSYDDLLYGSGVSTEFQEFGRRNTRADTLSSGSRKGGGGGGVQRFFDEVCSIGEDEEPEVLQQLKSKAISAREDDYRKQWRKRKLSLPETDPYELVNNPKKFKGANGREVRTYADVLKERQLEREELNVRKKITEKVKEEAEKVREEREKRLAQHSDSEDEGERQRVWRISVVKGGKTLSQIALKNGTVLRIGRDPSCDIVTEHPSCSSRHAKVTMADDDKGGRGNPPVLVDMGSTNGTFLNGKRIAVGTHVPLYNGAVVRFASSTREYVFMEN